MRTERGALLPMLLALWLCAGPSAGAGVGPGAGAGADALPCAGAAGEEDGLGGTGLGGDEDGLGGTGHGGDDEDGLGGTGIYGVISGLGSLCINGLHVELADGAELRRDGAPLAASALGVGQVAWLVARPGPSGLVAERIEIHRALLGAIGSADTPGRIRVAGAEVIVPADLAVLGLAPGDPVAVSGLWRDGALHATRIERLPGPVEPQVLPRPDLARLGRGLARLSIEGFASADAGTPRLHGLALSGAGELPRAGERVRVVGRPTDTGTLAVERVTRPTRVRPPAPPDVAPPERPTRPEPAPRPVRPDRIDRPSFDRVEPVERSPSTR